MYWIEHYKLAKHIEIFVSRIVEAIWLYYLSIF